MHHKNLNLIIAEENIQTNENYSKKLLIIAEKTRPYPNRYPLGLDSQGGVAQPPDLPHNEGRGASLRVEDPTDGVQVDVPHKFTMSRA